MTLRSTDHVLDAICMVGAVPQRFGQQGGAVEIDLYFAMARGRQDAVAMEMTKWFDTNYHYIVPEWEPDMAFHHGTSKAIKGLQGRQGPGAARQAGPAGADLATAAGQAEGGVRPAVAAAGGC